MWPDTFIKFSLLTSLLASSVAALPWEVYVAPGNVTTSDLHPQATPVADPQPPSPAPPAPPAATSKPPEIEDKQSITDEYLFNITLDEFIHERDQQSPPYLFWESDGCSESPDHPFGFDYLPACYRHDFGYDQYRRQGRFTQGNKAKLDLNFKNDLDNICSAPGLEADICKQCKEDPDRTDVDCKHISDICKFPAKDVCGCLAEIYYRAVVIFGGQGIIQPGRKEKRGGLFDKMIGEHVPKFDLSTLGLCLANNLPSAQDKSMD